MEEEQQARTNNMVDRVDETSVQGPARGPTTLAAVVPQAGCSTCGSNAKASLSAAPPSPSFVYAIGRIEPRCPRLAVEKEYSQAKKTVNGTGLTDQQILQKVLSDRQNRYIARQHCWVFTIQGIDTYILMPRDPVDYDLLIQTVRPAPKATDVDVVVGIMGPLAPPDLCNGLAVPVVYFDQIYSFDRTSLIDSLPKPPKDADKFVVAAGEVFDLIMHQADNAGSTDANRALNYMAVRDPSIYVRAAQFLAQNSSLTSLNVQTSPLSGARNIVEVICSYTDRQTDVVQKFFARVDVTEEFPFLVTKLSPYYDR